MSRPPEPDPDVIEVSRWSTSSSEEEEGEDGEGEGHRAGSCGSQSSQDKNFEEKESHDNSKKDDYGQNEKEVIYELDEDAMAQLPTHLQTNMREIQQERMNRVQRENSNVQIRTFGEQKEDRADKWFKNVLSRFPRRPSTSFHAKRDNIRRLKKPCLADMEPHERARLANELPLLPLTNLDWMEKHDCEAATLGSAHGRRVQKATSIKDRIYSRINDPRRSEPVLAHFKNIESQVHVGIPQKYANSHEDEQISAKVPEEEKQSLRGRVKKSMHKMSMAFKKG